MNGVSLKLVRQSFWGSTLKTQQKGREAEDLACQYLQNQGLRFVTRNYHCHYGEIDLILRDKTYLVFVEVRARSSSAFGGAAASVTYAKQQKIIKTAMHYLLMQKLHDKIPIRFDVIAIEGKPGLVRWIKHAFGVD